MDTNRRNFLLQTGSALGVLGLGALLWDDRPEPAPATPADAGRGPSPKRPPGSLLSAAMRRMRDEGKFGVAVRIPEDPKARHLAGHVLAAHLAQGGAEREELFAETVFVCLEGEGVREELSNADPSHAIFLFATTGRVLASIPFDYSLDGERFVDEVRSLVHGEARLKRRADAILADCDPQVARALALLESPEDKALVFERASTLAPLLVDEKLRAPAGRRRAALGEILRRYVASAKVDQPGPKLPFGVQMGEYGGGCGQCCREMEREAAVRCGMGRANPQVREFIRYLQS